MIANINLNSNNLCDYSGNFVYGSGKKNTCKHDLKLECE